MPKANFGNAPFARAFFRSGEVSGWAAAGAERTVPVSRARVEWGSGARAH